MDKIYKVAIVGGGASGLMTAVELLKGKNKIDGKDVVILERLDRVGKKLIATGNGQGNLSNADLSEKNYHGDKEFIREFLDVEKEICLEKYLTEMGIPLTTDKEGRKYPISKQASAVLDIIRAFILSRNVVVKTEFKVDKVQKNKDVFTICCGKNKVFARNLVLACGGKSQKQFGTDGFSYELAKSFSHQITKTYPALVQIKTELDKIRGLKGIKENVKILAYDGERLLKSTEGDIIFTEFGVSGNAIFKLSSYLADADNPKITISFLPEYSIGQISLLLLNREKLDYINNVGLLCGIVNKRVGEAIIKSAKSNKAEDIAYALKNFSLKITGSLGYDYSQVTKGGIKTSDIDCKTMQSKIVDNLYITGEMLDIDGDCGGYNLTFAFVSGILSARSIKNA